MMTGEIPAPGTMTGGKPEPDAVPRRDGRVLVRDAKQAGTGPVPAFSAPAWRRFARKLKER